MNALYAKFLRSCQREPSRRVLCARPGGTWATFSDLRHAAELSAAQLRSQGVLQRDVVLLTMGNVPAFIVSVLAIWAVRAVVLAADPAATDSEIVRLRETFRPVMHLDAPSGRRRIAWRAPWIRSRGPSRPRSVVAGLKDPASIRLTSGTSGDPQGAVMGTKNLLAGARAIIERLGVQRDEINVGLVPLNHAYGFDHLILPMILQGTGVRLVPRALPGPTLEALRGGRGCQLAAVPYLLDLLCRQVEGSGTSMGLRRCISAGAPLSRRTAEEFRARFGVPVRTFYGASEAGGITFDDSADADPPEGCVGRPMPDVDLEIDRGGLAGLPPGQGRVVVSGPAVGLGYVPRSSADFSPGVFRTSDIGSLDRSGRLHLHGRISSLVNVSGRKVNPAEIERAMLEIDGVSEAVVLGVKDPLRGESVSAWVVTRSGLSDATIRAALARSISRHKIPRTIRLVDSLPRTARGKLDRARLLGLP